MLVVTANHLPDKVRGKLKLWFVEPKPNVFVSGIKSSIAKKVIEYLYEKCPIESGLMIFEDLKQAPGYKIKGYGDTKRKIVETSGYQLIMEKRV